ncbi:MAG: methionyl-tRNA formyltransferase [Candidatus Magasanikbacteria bacterium CG_4_10_14_0_2_um_filter_33_14]|uniref:Methionyl-tRNA formyltransferase n=1 Tax=Candidatus Magasanikbacteria bacterium CG_4_10_14_0_2_um_filter_33_14 TaxID=1974636 RepID=A0A2M7VBA1_9BACT|nr:MAG: methionyl-tRNA formyltransferase [Candidatus Magasanikbacteria bacterium CG_4_10_14_0_2_um_filter_33_14]
MSISKTKIIFFGTHKFASVILQSLINDERFEIKKVITQPDKPVGRKQILQKSPVKLLAEENALDIDQPESLRNYELRTMNSELFIVAQYGLLIPESILNIPKFGTINTHTSLLPKYRGASPIQSAIFNGETKTGVTIMLMDKGMDSGPILTQKEVDILPDDTYLMLDTKMAQIASELLIETVPKYLDGEIQPQAQNESQITLCKKLDRDDGEVDWQKTTQEIYNQYRAFTPWPGVWTTWNNKRLKLLEIRPSNKKIKAGQVQIENDTMYIGTKNTSIEIKKLQLEGKPAMNAQVFINGYKNINGQNIAN